MLFIILYICNVLLAAWHLLLGIVWLYKPDTGTPHDGYWLNLAINFDQFCNALAGGDPNETISSRAGKAMREGRLWGCLLCRFLNLFQNQHCLKSIENNVGSRAVDPD